MVAINLNALDLVLSLITIIGTFGFQIGLYWTFKKQVELRLAAHEEKLTALDAARESTTLVLTKISLGVEGLDKRLDEMKVFCKATEGNAS